MDNFLKIRYKIGIYINSPYIATPPGEDSRISLRWMRAA